MRLGILGGGQLARMMALDAHRLGISVRVFDPQPRCSAAWVADHSCADYDDQHAIRRFIQDCDAVTCEFENIPAKSIESIRAAGIPFHPNGVDKFQNRYIEKGFLRGCGLPVTEYHRVADASDIARLLESSSTTWVIKSESMGYDGKGQKVLHEVKHAQMVWEELNQPLDADKTPPVKFLAEKWVNFDRELSLLMVRDSRGRIATYPMSVNYHHKGMLRWSLITPQSQSLIRSAERYALTIVEKLDYVGVIAVEFFQTGDRLLINEVAPRPHNSGHWTIDGAVCSQFENHIRAVLDLPLGSTRAHTPTCAMVNLVGAGEAPDDAFDPAVFHLASRLPGYARLHHYRKSHRGGRKLGHIYIDATDTEMAERRIDEVMATVESTSPLFDIDFPRLD